MCCDDDEDSYPAGSPIAERNYANGPRRVVNNDDYWPGDVEYIFCYEINDHRRYRINPDLSSTEI